MTVVPIENSDPRGGALERVLGSLKNGRQRVTLVKDGEPVAVVLDPLDLQGLEDTIELLSSPEASAALDEGLADDEAGRTYSSDEVAQDLRDRYLTEFGRPRDLGGAPRPTDAGGPGTTSS